VIKVLIVDDSALVRKLFGRVLSESVATDIPVTDLAAERVGHSRPEFEVAFARDGLEALEQLERFRPDVITLDVNMPQMNGLECLDRIMVQRPTPVVMVSTVTEEGADATLKALRLGAVDFVPKPSGAVSLRMDAFAPTFLDTIRGAASAKLRASKRLRERVRLRTGGGLLTTRSALRSRSDAQLDAESELELGEQSVQGILPQGEGLVLVGTSTGGPPALEALLVPLPEDFPWPILVAQHMPAGFTGPLAKRLNGICALNVVEAARPLVLQPGTVYIGRGDADIVVSKRPSGLVAMAVPAKANYLWHPSTDRLVRSAMAHLPAKQLIGVLMTGMGNDGAEAMTELRTQGGKTIAEAEETAIVWGMPGELVRAGGANWVVPLPKIAERLQRLVPSHATNS
jgi:two-component system chemotaxis response regulator CheB